MKKTAITKKCIVCGNEFKAHQFLIKKGQARFCSLKCKGIDMRGKKRVLDDRNCLICGKSFHSKPSKIKKGEGHYCSSVCFHTARLGVSVNKGVVRTEENKLRISQSRRGKLLGELNHSWKGGITSDNSRIRSSFEMKLWRKACMERDNFTDQKTGVRGGELRVHHINNFADFPELRTSIANGITLSKESHKDFHKKYGVKNNTREQLEEFLGKK